VGAAEVGCAGCGSSVTLPAGAERVTCPYCQAEIRKAGIR
jgi:LSD1 subclass zinc finger protein